MVSSEGYEAGLWRVALISVQPQLYLPPPHPFQTQIPAARGAFHFTWMQEAAGAKSTADVGAFTHAAFLGVIQRFFGLFEKMYEVS